MKYSTFIFDLDGTLLDTVQDLANAVNYALEIYGYEKKSTDVIASYLGDGIYKLIERAIPDGRKNENFDGIFDAFKNHYNENLMNFTKPYNDIIDLLEKLKKRKCKIAIVSNKSDKFVNILSKHFFEKYFDIAVGESENLHRKPSRDMVDYALLQLGVKSEDCVYIGDSEVDILTAKNSNLPCISVSWGFRTKEFLKLNGAITIVDFPYELLRYVKNDLE